MFQTKVVQKKHILCSVTFSQKSCRLRDNVEKHCRVGQATDVNIIQRMRFTCWIPKATHTHTHTHSEYAILISFPRQLLRERISMLRLHTLTYCL